jgi:hypothetical protein
MYLLSKLHPSLRSCSNAIIAHHNNFKHAITSTTRHYTNHAKSTPLPKTPLQPLPPLPPSLPALTVLEAPPTTPEDAKENAYFDHIIYCGRHKEHFFLRFTPNDTHQSIDMAIRKRLNIAPKLSTNCIYFKMVKHSKKGKPSHQPHY